MRTLILIIILISWFRSTSQNQYSLESIFEAKFKTDLDSINNTYLVKCSEDFLDSTTVNIQGNIQNINKYFKSNSVLGCQHRKKIKSYLYTENYTDSFAVFLSFYSNKLIEISVYFKGVEKTKFIKEQFIKHYKLQKYNWRAEDKYTKAYLMVNADSYNLLMISDKRAINFIPSICGNSRQRGSWSKLDKYLSEKK